MRTRLPPACAGVLVALAACGSPAPPAEPAPRPVNPRPVMSAPPREEPAPPPELRAEELSLASGSVAADLRLSAPGSPALILLPGAPPESRAGWPPLLLEELSARGVSVCAPDGSTREVAAACAARLSAHGVGKLAVLGSAEGTAGALAWAARPEGPGPAWLGLLSPGDWTVREVPLSAVEALPTSFFSPTAHRAWAAELKRGPDGQPRSLVWTFHEYPGEAQGQALFAAKKVVVGDVMHGVLRAVRAP